jgi:hypothetical protein
MDIGIFAWSIGARKFSRTAWSFQIALLVKNWNDVYDTRIFLGDGDGSATILKDDISVKRTTFCLEGMLKKRDVGACGAVNLIIFNSDGIQSNAINPP